MKQGIQAMRPTYWIVSILCLVVVSMGLQAGDVNPAPNQTFFIPQCGHGTAGGNFFTTEINLLNLSTTTSSATIMSFGNDGAPLDLLALQISETTPNVPANELNEVIPGLGTNRSLSLSQNAAEQLTLGWCQVTTPDALGIEVLLSIRDAQGNLTSTNLRPGPVVTEASFFGIVNPQAKTGMALLSPPSNQEMVFIDVALFDSNGDGVAEQRLELNPGQKAAFFLDDIFANLTNFDGSVDIKATMPIAILSLRQEGTVLTTQDIFPSRQP